MTDPDGMLAELRQQIKRWETAGWHSQDEMQAAERMTSAAGALDDWLSNGGLLPSAWLGNLRRDLAEKNAEIARLKAELDTLKDRNVLLVPASAISDAMDASRGERDGTVIRATDGSQEYELHGGAWMPR